MPTEPRPAIEILVPRVKCRAHGRFTHAIADLLADAVVHGCIPVIVQDSSFMFFEGAFAAAGLNIDFADFSLRLPEVPLAGAPVRPSDCRRCHKPDFAAPSVFLSLRAATFASVATADPAIAATPQVELPRLVERLSAVSKQRVTVLRGANWKGARHRQSDLARGNTAFALLIFSVRTHTCAHATNSPYETIERAI